VAAKRLPKPLPLPRLAGALTTVCDKAGRGRGQPHQVDITPEMLAQIKTVVSRYLPGMEGADVRAVRAHAECAGGDHACPTAQLGRGTKSAASPAPTTVVTLSKTIRASAHVHPHYARVTLDAQGQIVKLAVSR
jgi:hypothetical protein